MNISTFIPASAALLGALIALLVYHLCAVRPALRSATILAQLHDEALGTGAGPASTRIASLETLTAELTAGQGRVIARVDELESLARTDVSRVGFVRYDAFDDTSSELSYTLALLNRCGDGIVLSSIYSRSDTRTYGKLVENFKPRVHASDEELAAIERAKQP